MLERLVELRVTVQVLQGVKQDHPTLYQPRMEMGGFYQLQHLHRITVV